MVNVKTYYNCCDDDSQREGLISFTDKVSKYIPEFENLKCKDAIGETYNCKKDLTVFHLMTHRSGYVIMEILNFSQVL